MKNGYVKQALDHEKTLNLLILIFGLIIYVMLLMVFTEPLMFDFGNYLKQIIEMESFSNWENKSIGQSIYHSSVYVLMTLGLEPISAMNVIVILSILASSISLFFLIVNRTNSFISGVVGTIFFFFNPLTIALFASLYKQMMEVVCIITMLAIVYKFHDILVLKEEKVKKHKFVLYSALLFSVSVGAFFTSVLGLFYLLFFQITSIFLFVFSYKDKDLKIYKNKMFYVTSNICVILSAPISDFIAFNFLKFDGGSALTLSLSYIINGETFISEIINNSILASLLKSISNFPPFRTFLLNEGSLVIIIYLLLIFLFPLVPLLFSKTKDIKLFYLSLTRFLSPNLLFYICILSYIVFLFSLLIFPENIITWDGFHASLFPVWIAWLPFLGSLMLLYYLNRVELSERMKVFIIANGVTLFITFTCLIILVVSGYQQASGFPLRRVEIFLVIPCAFLAGISWEMLLKRCTNISFFRIVLIPPVLFLMGLIFINPNIISSLFSLDIGFLYLDFLALKIHEEVLLCLLLVVSGILSLKMAKISNKLNTVDIKKLFPNFRSIYILFFFVVSNLVFIYYIPPVCTNEEVKAVKYTAENIDANTILFIPINLYKWPAYYYINYKHSKNISLYLYDLNTGNRSSKPDNDPMIYFLEDFLERGTPESYYRLKENINETIWVIFSNYSKSLKYLDAVGIKYQEILSNNLYETIVFPNYPNHPVKNVMVLEIKNNTFIS